MEDTVLIVRHSESANGQWKELAAKQGFKHHQTVWWVKTVPPHAGFKCPEDIQIKDLNFPPPADASVAAATGTCTCACFAQIQIWAFCFRDLDLSRFVFGFLFVLRRQFPIGTDEKAKAMAQFYPMPPISGLAVGAPADASAALAMSNLCEPISLFSKAPLPKLKPHEEEGKRNNLVFCPIREEELLLNNNKENARPIECDQIPPRLIAELLKWVPRESSFQPDKSLCQPIFIDAYGGKQTTNTHTHTHHIMHAQHTPEI